CMQALQLPYTC
nr:immunoglobulin light chain junction region [Macaca mulatta]